MIKNIRLMVLAALAGTLMMGVAVRSGQQTKEEERHPVVIELGKGDAAALRKIGDPYPVFTGLTMDMESDEVIVADENRASLRTFPRQFSATYQGVMEPRREIKGPKSQLTKICAVTMSPEFDEVYTVNKDVGDNMVVFPISLRGDAAPNRILNVDHGAWGVFFDPRNHELFITPQHYNKISVFSRLAQGNDKELRYIQGPKTGLASPHGIYIDSQQNEIYVANHGHWRETEPGEGTRGRAEGGLGSWEGAVRPLSPSTGKFLGASITVHSRIASGNTAPLRTIQGPKTRLNWPVSLYVDTVSGQLAVANSGDDSILFFDRKADGDVAPARVIQGPATEINNPTGIFVDTKRNEIWVANWLGHSATVYPRTADGNVAPIRVLRSAPKGTPATGLGGAADIVYDPKRDQILAPN
ncbi:MAG: hypothetical protein HY315_09435 [Acidobacteria bacterium]|nr:hypothetical protein [Acidobacteriota bacterium]